MKQIVICIVGLLLLPGRMLSQGVGLGTQTPDSAALLDMVSTTQGVLFPRLTTAQRDAISDPPDGLHIYNTDHACLNVFYHDFQAWGCYCPTDTCHVIKIRISQNDGNVDFLTKYAMHYPDNRRFVVRIDSGVVISGYPAFRFVNLPVGTEVVVINHGEIIASGGSGGTGYCYDTCIRPGSPGSPGGDAILKDVFSSLTVYNYGLISAGGGGGGGGGGSVQGDSGGGGGGGAGENPGIGGQGGGTTWLLFGSCALTLSLAENGMPGTEMEGGAGGAGVNGGGTGGIGGEPGMAGLPGSGPSAGAGGLAGKAAAGPGVVVINMGNGLVIGAID